MAGAPFPTPAQFGERRHPDSLYDERAFLAALVGPLRLPWGASRRLVMTAATLAQRVRKNNSAQVLFVAVTTVPGQPIVTVNFGPNDIRAGSEVPHDFTVLPIFTAVLLPDDQLFAFAGGATMLQVTEVPF